MYLQRSGLYEKMKVDVFYSLSFPNTLKISNTWENLQKFSSKTERIYDKGQ